MFDLDPNQRGSTDNLVVVVRGCPKADGGPGCSRCDGGWPGTTVTTSDLTFSINTFNIRQERLGCQPLEERAREGYAKLNDLGIVPEG